jgi:hypothetical protein
VAPADTIFYGIPDGFNAVSRASSDELEITNAESVEADREFSEVKVPLSRADQVGGIPVIFVFSRYRIDRTTAPAFFSGHAGGCTPRDQSGLTDAGTYRQEDAPISGLDRCMRSPRMARYRLDVLDLIVEMPSRP